VIEASILLPFHGSQGGGGSRVGILEALAGKKALVTGGLGFIGSNLVQRLVQLGVEVVIVDSLIPEYGGNLYNVKDIADRVRVNISDIRDRYSLGPLVSGVDIIFNLAGQTSHMDSMADPFTDLEINCTAQLSLLEVCRRHNPGVKLVFASTRQIYGKPDYLPVDEAHLLRPVDVNGINKMAGEWYHILYNNVYGIRATALRLTNTFGPRMRIKDARQTFLGVWIRMALSGEPFQVWGGEQLRDFSYVDDVVDALLVSAVNPDTDGQVFNLAGSPPVSLLDLAEMVGEMAGAPFEVMAFPADRKRIDIGDYYADDSRFRAATGWSARWGLRDGLAETLDYYRSHLPAYVD
jgi:UDP-glucose 4-epimerase